MLLLATNYIPVVVNHLLMAFYSARVPFTCQVSWRLECQVQGVTLSHRKFPVFVHFDQLEIGTLVLLSAKIII